MAESTVPTNPADPGVLGLFGFAFATFLGNSAVLGVDNSTALMVGTAIMLGGCAQLIAGLLSYASRNLFGLTAFGAFGLFWITSGLDTLLHASGLAAPGLRENFWYLALWAVFVFALLGASFAASWMLTITLVFVDLLLILLAAGTATGSSALIAAGQWCGLISAVLALYMGTGSLWNLTYGRTILPQGDRH